MNSNQCVFFKQNLFCTINDLRFALFCGKSIRLFIGKISAAKNFIHWANDWRVGVLSVLFTKLMTTYAEIFRNACTASLLDPLFHSRLLAH